MIPGQRACSRILDVTPPCGVDSFGRLVLTARSTLERGSAFQPSQAGMTRVIRFCSGFHIFSLCCRNVLLGTRLMSTAHTRQCYEPKSLPKQTRSRSFGCTNRRAFVRREAKITLSLSADGLIVGGLIARYRFDEVREEATRRSFATESARGFRYGNC